MPRALPWPALMAARLGKLKLSPEMFWNMTLPELDAALRGAFGPGIGHDAPERVDLRALMSRFPDCHEEVGQ